MTTWDKRFTESPLKETLRDSLDLLDSLDPPPTFPDESDDVFRLRMAVRDIESRLELADYRLISEHTLGSLEQRASGLQTHLTQFQGTRDRTFLTGAVNELNDLIVAASQLPLNPWGDAQDAVKKLIGPLRSDIGNLKQRLLELTEESRTAKQALQQDMNQISSQSSEVVQNLEEGSNQLLESLRADVQTHASELSERAGAFESAVQSQIQRLDQAISNINDNFGNAEDRRTQAFQESQVTQRNEFNNQMEPYRQRYEEELEAQSTEGHKLINTLQETAVKAAQILGITAASGTADAYLRDADQQRKQADLWRLVVIGSLLLTVVTGFVTLSLLDPPANVPVAQAVFYYVGRTTIVGGIVALAAYAIKESGQHRRRERNSKQLANELTTFRPFLAELGETELNEQIKLASPRYFPGLPPSDPGQNQTDSPG